MCLSVSVDIPNRYTALPGENEKSMTTKPGIKASTTDRLLFRQLHYPVIPITECPGKLFLICPHSRRRSTLKDKYRPTPSYLCTMGCEIWCDDLFKLSDELPGNLFVVLATSRHTVHIIRRRWSLEIVCTFLLNLFVLTCRNEICSPNVDY